MQERSQWYKNTIEVSPLLLFFSVLSLMFVSAKQIERKLSSTAVQAQATPQGRIFRLHRFTTDICSASRVQ